MNESERLEDAMFVCYRASAMRFIALAGLFVAATAAAQTNSINSALLAQAQAGDAGAEEQVGFAYANGEGTSQDFAKAIIWYRKAAEQGEANAQYNLGAMYHEGQGVSKDYAEATRLFRKAADQGNVAAEWSLGALYNFGQGVTLDYTEAAHWYSKAADQGNADAQLYLGQLYANGQGVRQDYAQAAALYRRAADQGSATAQFNLGTMYHAGQGVPHDDAQATVWTRKAAEQGLADAQNNLGAMYHEGQGIPKDDVQATIWYRKAAEQGDATAQHNLSLLSSAAPQNPSIEQSFPLQVTIESTFETDMSAISQQQQAQAATMGMELPYFAVFHGKINGEDHWVLGCRKENSLRESIPCTNLPVGEYRGRWIHDYKLLQIVGGPQESPITRFLTVSNNVKSPPPSDDFLLHATAFDFPVRFPDGKSPKDYPALVHVYGGASLEIPVGSMPAHSSCTAHTWSAYQTSVDCATYPAIEIHRGYVTLDISVEAVPFASLHCEAKWRWSHCSMLDPGLYYARADKDRLVLLTHDQNGKPQEVGFAAEFPRDKGQSPIK